MRNLSLLAFVTIISASALTVGCSSKNDVKESDHPITETRTNSENPNGEVANSSSDTVTLNDPALKNQNRNHRNHSDSATTTRSSADLGSSSSGMGR